MRRPESDRKTAPLCSLRGNGKVMHVYEIRPRKFKRGFDLISDVPPFGVLWCTNADDAVNYANFSVEQTMP